MGTSSSSRGPKSNVPLTPPGVPPLPAPLQAPTSPDASPSDVSAQPDKSAEKFKSVSMPSTPQLALPRRFMSARTSLGKFGKSGSKQALKNGLGHYAKTGLGGATAATQRMARTAHTAGNLYGVLDGLRSGTPTAAEPGITAQSLAGKSARDIADTISNTLQPADGTQDAEAARDALAQAFSDLITIDPNVDLLALTPDQIDMVVEGYVTHDLCHRIELDVGASVLNKAPTPAEGIQRLEEMKEFIHQEVARLFRTRAEKGQKLTRKNAASLTAAVLSDTFKVFEEYIQ